MIVDPEAAEVVRLIFSLSSQGLGSIAIASELEKRKLLAPSVYKYQNGETKYKRFSAVVNGTDYAWCAATVSQILTDPVYTGTLVNLKTEVINYKSKKKIPVPEDRQIVTPNAHEAIISQELFDAVQQIRSTHICRANNHRFNLFRGKLFCECCGHPLLISKKQLKYRTTDIYFCLYHFNHPDVCPKTHRIYHDMLYPYVLQQVRSFAKSMKRRKINSKISQYASIEELTPEILDAVIERIEIGRVTNKSKPGSVIHIYWKLQ